MSSMTSSSNKPSMFPSFIGHPVWDSEHSLPQRPPWDSKKQKFSHQRQPTVEKDAFMPVSFVSSRSQRFASDAMAANTNAIQYMDDEDIRNLIINEKKGKNNELVQSLESNTIVNSSLLLSEHFRKFESVDDVVKKYKVSNDFSLAAAAMGTVSEVPSDDNQLSLKFIGLKLLRCLGWREDSPDGATLLSRRRTLTAEIRRQYMTNSHSNTSVLTNRKRRWDQPKPSNDVAHKAPETSRKIYGADLPPDWTRDAGGAARERNCDDYEDTMVEWMHFLTASTTMATVGLGYNHSEKHLYSCSSDNDVDASSTLNRNSSPSSCDFVVGTTLFPVPSDASIDPPSTQPLLRRKAWKYQCKDRVCALNIEGQGLYQLQKDGIKSHQPSHLQVAAYNPPPVLTPSDDNTQFLRPFLSTPGKQLRYERYLSMSSTAGGVITDEIWMNSGLDTDTIRQEQDEFRRSATLFQRPVAAGLGRKFVSSGVISSIDKNEKDNVVDVPVAPSSQPVYIHTATIGTTIASRNMSKFFPAPLLSKRLGLPTIANPYLVTPSSPTDDVAEDARVVSGVAAGPTTTSDATIHLQIEAIVSEPNENLFQSIFGD